MDDVLNSAISADSESKDIEFKKQQSISSNQDWCEIIKDIVAIANSGGGIILFGVDDKGGPIGRDVSSTLNMDPAKVTDKIEKYTGVQFSDFQFLRCTKNGHEIAALRIKGCSIPMVFRNPGTYPTSDGKQKTAFGKGTIYFRHGAKSEPGTTDDLKQVIERELEAIRDSWLGNIKKVVEAPINSKVIIASQDVVQSDSPGATPIRITDDMDAPTYRLIDPDKTHPYRQKELVDLVNQKLAGKHNINQHDIQALKVSHNIHEDKKFCHRPKFGSFQYSDALAEWIVSEYNKNPDLFVDARRKWYQRRYASSG